MALPCAARRAPRAQSEICPTGFATGVLARLDNRVEAEGMRIALLTRRFDPAGGGTERDLITTLDVLRRGGHEVTIYAGEVRGSLEGCEVRAVHTPRVLGRTVAILRFAYLAPALARRSGSELVISFARVFNADVMRSGGGAHVAYLQAARRWRSEPAAGAMWVSPYHLAQVATESRAFRPERLNLAPAVSNP